MTFTPIGTIHSPFTEHHGTPVQPALAQGVEGRIEILPAYAEALADLEGFERIWLLFVFDRARPVRLKVTPYLDTAERGLFATRAPSRPNPIGMSCVRLLAVEGCTLRVADLDVLDGTPLLDIKPYITRFDHWAVERCGWQDSVSVAPRADDRFAR